MSDLDRVAARPSTAVHPTTAAPVSAQALGKLRAIGGNGLLFGEADGLVDAFAEVFASIAASRPVDAEAPVDQPQAVVSSDDESVQRTEGESSDSGDDSGQAAESKLEVEKVAVEEAVGIVTEVLQASVEPLADQEEDAVEAVLEIETQSHETIERVEIAPVEVEAKVAEVEEIEAPVLVVQQTSLEDGNERRRRDAEEQPILQPISDGDTAKQRRDRSSPEDSALRAVDNDSITDAEIDLDGLGAGETDDGSRSVRDRRNRDQRTDHFGHANQVTQNSQRGSDVTPSLTRTDAPSDLASPTVAPSSDTASTSKEASNVQGQNVAAALQRSAANSGVTARSTGHARGTLQAVESLNSPRESLKPKAEAEQPQKNARSETVSRVKLIQRVSKAFQHFGPEGGVVRLRLAPAELGSVRLEMRIQQRRVEARVVAETEAAGAVLREHLPDLRQRLEAQGMQIERIEIETEGHGEFTGQPRDRGSETWSDSSRDQKGWREGSQNQSPAAVEVSHAAATHETDSKLAQAAVRRGGIDLRL